VIRHFRFFSLRRTSGVGKVGRLIRHQTTTKNEEILTLIPHGAKAESCRSNTVPTFVPYLLSACKQPFFNNMNFRRIPRLHFYFVVFLYMMWILLLLHPLIQGTDGFSNQPAPSASSKSTPTTTYVNTKSESTTPRTAASLALMESMAQKSSKNQKPKIAVRQLEQSQAFMAMDTRDRAFARLLLSTTERRMGQIDVVLQKFVHKAFAEVGRKHQLCRKTRQSMGNVLTG
jgi:hypothetical protein